ncbi:hypothetical protein MID13_20865 [Vibrio gigantis]|uniref:hypothetical protein n=1 Tax=Vibrio gigantis TaxID=296199 RepID=UPI001EFAAFCA|nr:hypothetical protein [Vibrio gigantis]ULN66045.1 hypothetical protein MID13_20865 [Vibrio gigantis]
MSISGIQSGYAIIQQSTNMAEEAAIELNQASKHSLESESDDTFQASDLSFNQIEPEQSLSFKDKEPEPASSSTDSLIKLTQSASYNRVGASVVDRQNEAIGSLLDIHI